MSKTERAREALEAAKRRFRSDTAYFRHYKGGVYKVLGLAIDTDTGGVRIHYYRVDGPGFDEKAEAEITFVRPIDEWFDEVDLRPRFVPVRRSAQRTWETV